MKKVIIGHDGKGFGAGWFLDSVTVDVPSHGQQLKFACNRWLASDEDDGLIERELYPSEEIEMSKSKLLSNEIWLCFFCIQVSWNRKFTIFAQHFIYDILKHL